MFEFLKGREQKLIEAIESGDLETLGPLLNKFDASSINAPLKDGQTCQLTFSTRNTGVLRDEMFCVRKNGTITRKERGLFVRNSISSVCGLQIGPLI